MITESFDSESPEIVNARDAIPQRDKDLARAFPLETVILTFSGKLIDMLREKGLIEPLHEVLTIGSAAYRSPVFQIPNTTTGVVLSGIGAPALAAVTL